MNALAVRSAGDDDADRLAMAALRRAWAEEDAGAPIDDPGYEAVGLLTVVVVERIPQPGRPDSGWGYVHHFFVLPEHRSAGIGAALMDAAVADARSRGWQQLVLHPRPESRPFYERAGFVPADLVVLPLD